MPADFQFGFKVTDAITLKRFKNLPRFGARAGRVNPDFLNADLFASAFLKPCEEFRQNVGLLMFEFSRFWPIDDEHGRDFLAALDLFLSKLPKGWPYAVELPPKVFLFAEQHGLEVQRVSVRNQKSRWIVFTQRNHFVELAVDSGSSVCCEICDFCMS